jgi:hypothetical protein
MDVQNEVQISVDKSIRNLCLKFLIVFLGKLLFKLGEVWRRFVHIFYLGMHKKVATLVSQVDRTSAFFYINASSVPPKKFSESGSK